MSLILDALRRAERDRRNRDENMIEQLTVQTAAAATELRAGAPRWLLPSAAGVIALLFIALVVMLVKPRFGHQPQANHTQVASADIHLIPAGQTRPHPQATAAAPQPHPKPAAPTPQPTTSAPAAKPAATPGSTGPSLPDADRIDRMSELLGDNAAPTLHHVDGGAPSIHPQPAATGTPPGVRIQVSHDQVPAPQPAAATPASTPASTPESTASLSSPTSQPNDGTEATTASDSTGAANDGSGSSDQSLSQMPESYRANFPQFTVQVLVYDPDPAKSWALIDGKRYHAGQSLPSGPKIYRIVHNGIVFDWHGKRVLYKSGQ